MNGKKEDEVYEALDALLDQPLYWVDLFGDLKDQILNKYYAMLEHSVGTPEWCEAAARL